MQLKGVKTKIMRKLLPICALLILAACGFEPVYGTLGHEESGSAVEDELAQVYIDNIPDYEGQYLRNALIDRFYRSGRPGNPRYTLTATPVRKSLSDLDITKTADTTRAQLRLDTTISLIDRSSGEVVMTRAVRAITSYNILASEFATRVSEQNTRENALNDLARQITQHVSLYFNH